MQRKKAGFDEEFPLRAIGDPLYLRWDIWRKGVLVRSVHVYEPVYGIIRRVSKQFANKSLASEPTKHEHTLVNTQANSRPDPTPLLLQHLLPISQRIPPHNIPRKAAKPKRLARLIVHRNVRRRGQVCWQILLYKVTERIGDVHVRVRESLIIEPRKRIRIGEETHPHAALAAVRGPCGHGAEARKDIDGVEFDLLAAHVDAAHAPAREKGEINPAILLTPHHRRRLQRERKKIPREPLRARIERKDCVSNNLAAVYDSIARDEDSEREYERHGHGVVLEGLGAVAEVLQDVAGRLGDPHPRAVGVDVVVGEEVS